MSKVTYSSQCKEDLRSVNSLEEAYYAGMDANAINSERAWLSTMEDEDGVDIAMRMKSGEKGYLFIELTKNQKALIRNHLKRGEL